MQVPFFPGWPAACALRSADARAAAPHPDRRHPGFIPTALRLGPGGRLRLARWDTHTRGRDRACLPIPIGIRIPIPDTPKLGEQVQRGRPPLTLSRQLTFSVGYTTFPQRAHWGFMVAVPGGVGGGDGEVGWGSPEPL